MPPRGHSSSSHSSSSRSSGSSFRSSSSSSFRSSSSRSSSSSFRGPSAHSSSSYSSRPSAFGGSSHKTTPPTPSRPQTVWRPRVNQPTGFVSATHLRPTYYYGLRHSYAYYPRDWVDAATGASFTAGYYDENGQRYDSVTFQENGRYKNVVCHCPYCDNETVMDLSAGDVESKSLQCPNCGAPMEIRSELDSVLDGTADGAGGETAASAQRTKRKSRGYIWIAIAMIVMVLAISRSFSRLRAENSVTYEPAQSSFVQDIGSSFSGAGSQQSDFAPVYLEKQDDGSYHVVTDVVRADKVLYFDTEFDSYCDEESECWLWKNTDVVPPVWQYWFEGISSDFGDYGWMEHDETGWYIERSAGDWVPLPVGYDTSALWYIE